MRARALQPAGNYWTLNPAQREMRETVNRDLAEMIRQIRGDPWLTAWEEGFLANVEAMLRRSHFHINLSARQWDRFWLISDELPSRRLNGGLALQD
jgi:hypothetical protein